MSGSYKNLTSNPAAIIVIASLSGGGGHYAVATFDPPRPDPFYGSQGRDIERRVKTLEEVLRKDYPPKWLIDQVSRNTIRADTCEALLTEIRIKHD